ncbi:hypothetical protein JOQ06_015449 [Pogonophryne albipinna]|uniref:Uncharacterized protein n=1 Tax=Pogonophryne albipinna TaxID=1090488 RepID=A0AAD6FBB8_9TELE|nr:hypothetical protein JOQ06_015449 [Pogonophryne albipinna]
MKSKNILVHKIHTPSCCLHVSSVVGLKTKEIKLFKADSGVVLHWKVLRNIKGHRRQWLSDNFGKNGGYGQGNPHPSQKEMGQSENQVQGMQVSRLRTGH